jgi:hypothetical protein
MKTLSVALVALATVLASRPALSLADCSCPNQCAPAPKITNALVVQHLNELLRSEGLSQAHEPLVTVRSMELDNDLVTAEALVDVLTPEHCTVGGCTTLVVQIRRDGSLVSIGHGKWLTALGSSTQGWIDLAEGALPLFVARALKFSGARYQ